MKKKQDILSKKNSKLLSTNTYIKERIIKHNKLIKIIDEEKVNLQFQLQLFLMEVENNIKVIEREFNSYKRKV